MNPFLAALSSHQAAIIQALIDGVAFLNCDVRTNFVPMYTVYSHEGDDIAVFTQHDVESVIHMAKRAGYGYFKLPALFGCPVGLTFHNYGPAHGEWSYGNIIGKSEIPVLALSIKQPS
jgi:hypothetical protein